ncbi:MAG: molybdate ABC transporter substrate-binding protein [Janthinobacterium lividum]
MTAFAHVRRVVGLTRRGAGFLLAGLAVSFASTQAMADDLVVSAASSLTNAFGALASAYEKAHPQTHVVLNFAASDVLMQQIVKGAPADVFASADQVAMDKAQQQHVVDAATRRNFARNALVLIVPAQPAPNQVAPRVTSVADLSAPAVTRIAMGDPASVPVGRYAQSALRANGNWDALSGKTVLAQNVRQALDYVARGEVDAGFVFATDAAIMPKQVRVVAQIATPTPISYPIAEVTGAKKEAHDFIDFVVSKQGQDVLASYGFQQP